MSDPLAGSGLSRVAAHVLLWQGDTVLMLRRFQTGFEDGNYSVVSGHTEPNESVRSAAIREAHEEAGVTIAPSDLQFASVLQRNVTDERIDFFFSVRRWSGAIENREPAKCDDLRWCRIDDLPHNTVPYVRRVLENVRRGVFFDEFLSTQR